MISVLSASPRIAIRLGALVLALAASAVNGSNAQPVATPEPIAVAMDLATVVKVPERTAMLVIGNPSIADATIQRNGLIVLTGKSFGTTNVIALDNAGSTVREFSVTVKGAPRATLVVQRGPQRESYSCAPSCERVLTLGDDKDFFDSANQQIKARNATAAGSTSSESDANPR